MGGALPVLFADEHLAVVNKPSGMLVHRGFDRDPVVAMTALRDQLGRRVHPVHRLDRGTSGALLFAFTPQVTAALQGQLERGGEARKRYLALVRGIAPEEALVDHPVPGSEGGPRVPAVTRTRRLFVFEQRFSVVEAFPLTGRFHQVRRHLKHLGHPIVGDVNYGRGEVNRLFRERFGLHRLALHCERLSLVHPITRSAMSVAAPLPEDLAGPLARMGVPLAESAEEVARPPGLLGDAGGSESARPTPAADAGGSDRARPGSARSPAPVHHRTEYKTMIDTLRVAGANAEAELADQLAPHLLRPKEAKRCIQNLFAATGDIKVTENSIAITLDAAGTSNEREAFAHLLATMNGWKLHHPGDPKRRPLRFRVQGG